ncbi:hypothetical protein [Lacrimispora amygdalina]|uniref:hypothetical protein n=1 Tax=Lacrimispora amygdalina TaxID=253257 RepID=UPI0011C12589|nr:hypothetical protein [Clostridium indicum]
MGCFWGCGNNCGCNGNNNCRCNCNGNGNNNGDDVECAEQVRRAYWAGFRAGCNDPRCHHHHHHDDDDC